MSMVHHILGTANVYFRIVVEAQFGIIQKFCRCLLWYSLHFCSYFGLRFFMELAGVEIIFDL